MHELPIIKSIYTSVMDNAKKNNAKSVTKVFLEVGVLRDFVPHFMKKYWAFVTEGDIAQGSQLLIRELPAKAKCGECGKVYKIDPQNLMGAKCPKCGYDRGELIAGRELSIFGIEIT